MNSLMNGCDFRMMDSDAPTLFPASGKSLPTLATLWWQVEFNSRGCACFPPGCGPQGLETVGLENQLCVHQREEQPASNPKALAC